jgi:hypothetical protein
MRVWAVLLLLVLVPLMIFGIEYVPHNDGRVVDALLVVILPAAGACWCLVQLLPHPRGADERARGD